MEQLMKEFLAIVLVQLLEHIAGSVGKSSPEPENLLKLLLRLNYDHVARRLRIQNSPIQARTGPVFALRACDPRCDIAARGLSFRGLRRQRGESSGRCQSCSG